jgi:hypothetical protein
VERDPQGSAALAFHIGTVNRVERGRIKLTQADSGQGSPEGHHHHITLDLVATVEGRQVRLPANGDVAVQFQKKSVRNLRRTLAQW